jgi:hypothetical protein
MSKIKVGAFLAAFFALSAQVPYAHAGGGGVIPVEHIDRI